MQKDTKYYVVWQGRIPGIYTNWNDCLSQVKGVSNARYKLFSSYTIAQKAYKSSYTDYYCKGTSKKHSNRISYGIAVDGAYSHKNKKAEYQGIDLKINKRLFHGGPYTKGTNNLVEFLALVHALQYCHHRQIRLPIYSDSKTAMSWVRDKKIRSVCCRCQENKNLFEHIDQALNWLKNNSYNIPIFKWDTSSWGENPADFGRK